MTQREKFFETVGILVEAYLNDTLVHDHPCGCGGGNIIAKAIGVKILVNHKDGTARWIGHNAIGGGGWDWFHVVKFGTSHESFGVNSATGQQLISQTGYTIKNMRDIETAFERPTIKIVNGERETDISLDHDGLKGLLSIVDVLACIHGINLEERESAKLLFKKESV